MNINFSLVPHQVHLWRAWLPDLVSLEASYLSILQPDEIERAKRFRFPLHRQRFVITRGILRQLLSLYTEKLPQDVMFSYNARGKPFLKENEGALQFNVSHSHDLAVFTFSQQADIGIDVEKKDEFSDAVAKRFFHASEYEELMRLPESKRQEGFFRLWAAKEALIKAVGEGLYVELNEFCVSLEPRVQTIVFLHGEREFHFHLEQMVVHPDYCAAFAVDQMVNAVSCLEWTLAGPQQSPQAF